MRPIRCAWCLGGLHWDCVVVVGTGNRWKKVRVASDKHPGTWRCECGCEYSLQVMCPDCRRSGAELRVLKDGRCSDREDCRRVARSLAPKLILEKRGSRD